MAAERFVGRKPGGGVGGTLVLVRGAVRSHQVERIVGQLLALPGRQLLGALLPGVAQGHDVVDLHVLAALRPAAENDQVAGIRIVERSGGYPAPRSVAKFSVRQVAAQDVVARVAAVAVHIQPRLAKGGPVVVVPGGAALDGEGFQGRLRGSRRDRPGRGHRLHPAGGQHGSGRGPGGRLPDGKLAGGEEPGQAAGEKERRAGQEGPCLAGPPSRLAEFQPGDRHGCAWRRENSSTPADYCQAPTRGPLCTVWGNGAATAP